MPERFVTMKTLLTMIPYSRQHIYRLMTKGHFPQSIKLGESRVAWRKSDVEDWLRSREAGVPFEDELMMTTDEVGLPCPVYPLRRKRKRRQSIR